MSDLELVKTQELIDELLSRFDHSLFAGLKVRGVNEHFIVRNWAGNTQTVVGLATDISHTILTKTIQKKHENLEDA